MTLINQAWREVQTHRDGFRTLLLLLNPKAYIIMALMFTQFVADDTAAPWLMVIVITTVFTLNNLVAFLAWTAAGDARAAETVYGFGTFHDNDQRWTGPA